MTENTRRILYWALALVASALMCWSVFHIAWVADDAFITLRYVQNTLEGNGIVYNVGDRVQGFTHPLWFLLLLAGSTVFYPPMFVMSLGMVLTFCTMLVLGYLHRNRFGTLICTAAALGTCYTFREFQTSGMENSCTILLLVCLITCALSLSNREPEVRAWMIVGFSILIVFNRLDQALLIGPVCAGSMICLWKTQDKRNFLQMRSFAFALLAAAVFCAWYLWAWWYYGTPLPNTFYAKLGAIPMAKSFAYGVAYVIDFARDEPFPAFAAIAGIGISIFYALKHGTDLSINRLDTKWTVRLLLSGIVLQLAYIVWIGGDFMRGRFLDSSYVCATVLGVWSFAQLWPKRTDWLAVFLIVGMFSQYIFDPIEPTGRIVADRTIMRESTFWIENRWHWIQENRFEDHEFPLSLRKYAEKFGPITIKEQLIGSYGWVAGSKVTIIDVFGLTDATIARMPALPTSRIGHIRHPISESYFAQKGVLDIQPNWMERVRTLDPTLREDALKLAEAERKKSLNQ